MVPLRTSTFSSISSSPPKPPQPQVMQPLKIKLTVPPNLKFRKNLSAVGPSSAARHVPSQSHPADGSSRAETVPTPTTIPQQVALSILDPAIPKRRGRPPKAVVAAREAARAALASAHTAYSATTSRPIARKGTHVTVTKAAIPKARKQNIATTKGRTHNKTTKQSNRKRPLTALSTSSHIFSSEDEASFPTFMSAASTSSLTSSSESSPSLESSDSSESSDSEDEDKSYLHDGDRDKAHLKDGGDPSQKRRDHAPGNRWEIKPRKQSVDPEELGMDADSEDASDEEEGADDEDDSDDEDEDDEGAAEADIEEEGLAEVEEEQEIEDMDGKLGVSFGGLPTGWSEDEESSFDADLFFANLDDSSDSCGSPAALRLDSLEDMDEDSAASFSGDEEDALLLMDIDPSVQVRRTHGEFEVGVELDGLTFGFDGQLLLPAHFSQFAAFEGPFADSNETDVDMTISQGESCSEDEAFDASDGEDTNVLLQESDGETTEDELIDSNGLPNQKAMALFRWPAPITTVDPLSTVKQSPSSEDIHDSPPASRTLRLALEAMASHRDSPVGNASNSVSMEELEEIDHHTETLRLYDEAGRTPGVPTMGQFVTSSSGTQERCAVIDGKGVPIPSPFPRSKIGSTKRRKSCAEGKTIGTDFLTVSPSYSSLACEPSHRHRNQDTEARQFGSATHFVTVYAPSSDEFGSQSHAQTSDDPSSTDVIDLDDVLDVSFLDSEPTMFDSDTPQNWLSPSTPTASGAAETLNRWDRIPVGTFRRTRETSLHESTPGSDSGLANLYPAISALLNNDMLGTPKSKAASKKASSKKRSKSGASSALVVSPVLLPVRDGDRTPTGNGHPLYNPFQQNGHTHQQKSRKELRKEKAMMKRKMIGKHANPSPRNHTHIHRHHYPNSKTRGSSSVQRTHLASSSHVPHLNL